MDRSIFDRILSESNIVDIISEFVDLTKKGQNYVSVCPFLDHSDSKPSFIVSPHKQIFKCFGCGRGGNVFTFLMEYRGCTFIEAAKYLADKLGIEFKLTSGKTDVLYEINSKANFVFVKNLGQENYFESRGLNQGIIETFSLGHAKKDSLVDFEEMFDGKDLDECGLFRIDGFDRLEFFTNRYMFPVYNLGGKVVGFGGRSVNGREPKYLNSPETKLFDKSSILYGLYQTKDFIRQKGYVIIVEGYFDLLHLYQAGVCNVVAVCGTALTSSQAKLLKRYVNKAILVFDGDSAGQKAVDKAFSSLYSNGMDVYYVRLLEGKDPSDIVVENKLKFIEYLKAYKSWFEKLPKKIPVGEQGQWIEYVRDIYAQIEDLDYAKLFLRVCSDRLVISETLLTTKRSGQFGKKEVGFGDDYVNDELMLLAGLIKGKGKFLEHNKFTRDFFSTEELKKLFDNISVCEGNEAKLFYELDANASKVMNYLIGLSKYDIDVQETVNAIIDNRIFMEQIKLVANIKVKTERGENCEEMMNALNRLLKN